jgi:hypothetical protein
MTKADSILRRLGRNRPSGDEAKNVVRVQHMLVEVEDAERKRQASEHPTIHENWGPSSVMESRPPWSSQSSDADGPNMLSGEERQYLRWIASSVKGVGKVVELGPWLGQSTRCLLDGLDGPQDLVTVDDFVWRSSWMDDYLAKTSYQAPANHDSFLPLFQEVNHTRLSRLDIIQARFSVSDGNEGVPPFVWTGEPIELLVVDCGRNQELNETWYRAVKSSLVGGQTLVVMQDWRLFREVPFRWYNQTRQFTESKASELTLHHEVSDGGLASFLYTG